MDIFLALWSTYKISRTIDSLFNSNFFQSLLVDGKSMSFKLYWLINGLILDTLWRCLLILSRFNATVTAY